ncbi:hypothetical protein CANARDRAFT_198607 [[Candida] arabinofermentans NRRL YB-2248]|uniref:Ribosome assembly protein 1 n=1 Tax=[Candida] arabinofermentans NRRL YB-2248 TaxID=983967 RepID=A0A1E4T0V0_9ASCO|nr:hypothetical protein CANARDRAFT_198607 [[Candida] arabinofermentans NRRL YB-2248]
MRLTADEIARLQSNPSNIRNICILAHVDHGKTSLSDSLLASNGIISQRMAGKVRYLDSRPDEQLRGITMESSAISLYFKTVSRSNNDNGEPKINEHLINLIDSPGHIDFSSEVSTASRLCDGAVVLVDVVEGVCSQTITVLRQAWVDKLKPILVLNKIDRLIVELQMTSLEAYLHLSKVIEQVNSVIGSFFAGERMQDDLLWRERQELGLNEEFIEKNDDDIYFSPELNNVIFASAIDGWGFNIAQFSVLYEKKLGVKREILQKCLWGDFYFDPKTKKVISSKQLKGRNLKPLFVTFVLDNIWHIYDSCLLNKNQEKLEKIVKSLNLKILPRDLRSKDTKQLINSIFTQWLPVSNAVLLTVIDKLPSPFESQKERIEHILNSISNNDLIDKNLKNDMIVCNSDGLISCYVSKMVSIPEDELPQNQRMAMTQDEMFERGRLARLAAAKAAEAAQKLEEKKIENEDSFTVVNNSNAPAEFEFEYEDDEDDEEEDDVIEVKNEVLIGFSRIYSGSISVGQELTVLEPKFDPNHPTKHTSTVTITGLYLIMGRDLVSLEKVPAGNIVGIVGLKGKVLKSGTLISPGIVGVNLAGVNLNAPPIVRVALEPVNPTHMERLIKGLELLNQADPCVQTFVQDTGEHILATAGELHLERCLKDLRERFAGIEITASKPDIPFRETIVSNNEMNPIKDPILGRGVINVKVDKYSITLETKPLSEEVITFLTENEASISKIVKNVGSDVNEEEEDEDLITGNNIMPVELFKENLKKILDPNSTLVDRIASFGPKRVGANILFDSEDHIIRRLFASDDNDTTDRFQFEESIFNGFQLATYEGPLAAEPIQGIAVIIKSLEILKDDEDDTIIPISNISGRLISIIKDAIHKGFLDWSPRLMLAMYSCDIQASAEVLGKVYAVVQKRKGSVINEEMKEGTPFFTITAKIPVIEAFGFSEDIRKKTSGAASPQLIFTGFEIIDQDPFWVPTTEEELEELGEFSDKVNIARKYMNNIRKKKGLFIDEKVIQNAEKQRTLKKD